MRHLLVLLLCIIGYVISQNLEANSTISEKSLNETGVELKDNRNYTERLRETVRSRGKSTSGGQAWPVVVVGLVFVLLCLSAIAGVLILIYKCVRKCTGHEYHIQDDDENAPPTALTSGRPSVSGRATPPNQLELHDLTTIDEGNESRVSSGYGPPPKETRATLYGTLTRSQSSAL